MLDILNNDGLLFLDGAMGTMLQRAGLAAGERPELYNLTNPAAVTEIHNAYADAGARLVLTNTFGANRKKLAGTGKTPREVICAAALAAKKSRAELVALDIGPIGELLKPLGTLSFDEAYDIFREQAEAGAECGADLIYIETMTDLYEAKAAVLAAKEGTGLPVFCTMSFEEGMRTFTGCPVSAMALTLEGLGADAIGINCSLGPEQMLPMLSELKRWTSLPVIIKPNAGLPRLTGGAAKYDVAPREFAESMLKIAEGGARILGGCCGTSPEYIKRLTELCGGFKVKNEPYAAKSAVCSATKTVEADRVRVIGERINPTGKPRLKDALSKGDTDYIVSLAVAQRAAGADILDVNVGLPGIDERAAMLAAIDAVQSAVDLPLQIDSSDVRVLEDALRRYCGKPLVNSVNAGEKSLSAVLPVVKKYGAAVVGLTLDEDGIPDSAEKRFLLAEKIVSRAEACGIRRCDVYIDCLTLTSGAQQETAYETLTALRLVKERLGVKAVLGVSNISFGLPSRETLNHAFLLLAMGSGLDFPIINPNSEKLMDAVYCYHQLKNIDAGSTEYIARFSQRAAAPAEGTAQTAEIGEYIRLGLAGETKSSCRELLKKYDPLEVVNEKLIPALDRVGDSYERGEIFLPQLIRSADAAKAGFDAVRERLAGAGARGSLRGKIILATVKGDVHDIGKNIVKVVLENYGYEIVDLGRDVAPDAVLAAAEDGCLVGLSALMTTTVGAMEETIALIKKSGKKCGIMVGGAVLTAEYAAKIGADFYAKDVRQSAIIAEKYFG